MRCRNCISLLFLHNLSGRSVLLNAGDTVLARLQFLVSFAGGNDLAIGSLKAEAIFFLLILVDLKLRILEEIQCLAYPGSDTEFKGDQNIRR